MFRYNGIIVDLLKDQVIMSDYTVDGYAPLYGEMKKSPEVKTIDGKPIQDTLKLNMMEESIARMSQVETRLVMVASPKYGATSSETFNPIKGMCSRYGVEFFLSFIRWSTSRNQSISATKVLVRFQKELLMAFNWY